jgi:hypothetical protein
MNVNVLDPIGRTDVDGLLTRRTEKTDADEPAITALRSAVERLTQEQSLLARLVGGWGVLGGLRLIAPKVPAFSLFGATGDMHDPNVARSLSTLVPNPQVVAGCVVRVTAGAAVDANGRVLVLDGSLDLDLSRLTAGLPAVEDSRECDSWLGSFCSGFPGKIRGTEYWVVARAGQPEGPDGTAHSVQVSESLHVALVSEIPALYFIHGNLTPVRLPCIAELVSILIGTLEAAEDLQEVLNGPATSRIIEALTAAQSNTSAGRAVADIFGGAGFKLVPQLTDFINSIPVYVRISTPGVVLGRVLLASSVPAGVENALGRHPYYTLIDDAFPYRRLVPNGASCHLLLTGLVGALVTATDNVDGERAGE